MGGNLGEGQASRAIGGFVEWIFLIIRNPMDS